MRDGVRPRGGPQAHSDSIGVIFKELVEHEIVTQCDSITMKALL